MDKTSPERTKAIVALIRKERQKGVRLGLNRVLEYPTDNVDLVLSEDDLNLKSSSSDWDWFRVLVTTIGAILGALGGYFFGRISQHWPW